MDKKCQIYFNINKSGNFDFRKLNLEILRLIIFM